MEEAEVAIVPPPAQEVPPSILKSPSYRRVATTQRAATYAQKPKGTSSAQQVAQKIVDQSIISPDALAALAKAKAGLLTVPYPPMPDQEIIALPGTKEGDKKPAPVARK
jgi:hypothetical protein